MNDIAFSVIINNDGIDDIIFKTIMVKGEKGDGGTAIASIEKTSTSGNVDTYTVYLEDGSVAGTFTVTNAILPETATIEDVEIASFSDGADDVPVSELIVDIEPVQAGSGEPSPTNVRPISGWSEANVTRTGKNLFDINSLSATDITIADGVASGTANAFNTAFNLGNNGIPCYVPSQQFTFSFKAYTNGVGGTSGNGLYFRIYYTDNTYTQFTLRNETTTPTEFSVSSDANKTPKYIVMSFGATGNNTWYLSNIQIELGSTATAYEPYTGTTATIPFGQTVYCGSLDVTTGVLTIDGAIVDLGSLTWNYSSPYALFFTDDLKDIINLSDTQNLISDIFKTSSLSINESNNVWSQQSNYTIGKKFASDVMYIYVKDTNYSDKNTFASAMSGKYLCYTLATPITIQLTPAQVRTVLNDNNIFADTGKIQKVVYFKTGCEALARLIDAFK